MNVKPESPSLPDAEGDALEAAKVLPKPARRPRTPKVGVNVVVAEPGDVIVAVEATAEDAAPAPKPRRRRVAPADAAGVPPAAEEPVSEPVATIPEPMRLDTVANAQATAAPAPGVSMPIDGDPPAPADAASGVAAAPQVAGDVEGEGHGDGTRNRRRNRRQARYRSPGKRANPRQLGSARPHEAESHRESRIHASCDRRHAAFY